MFLLSKNNSLIACFSSAKSYCGFHLFNLEMILLALMLLKKMIFALDPLLRFLLTVFKKSTICQIFSYKKLIPFKLSK
ncbi:Uncharacterised protein [Mycoplasmoides gallisepticum]|uniref:Uncharacterized protein n=1 Tax=Mycoplasmoides gallisepticum TaxID=2096 RepID=A0A3B0PBK3_MYCGL|nr:Uncharacterised protein [Mycoplasmoides gallisepticum]